MVRSALRAAAAASALPTPPDIQGLGIEGPAPDAALMRAVSRGLATYSRPAGPGLRPDRQTAQPNRESALASRAVSLLELGLPRGARLRVRRGEQH